MRCKPLEGTKQRWGKIHLNRIPPAAVLRTDFKRGQHGSSMEPAKIIQMGGDGGFDQGGKNWLDSGCVVFFRELTKFCDR